MSPSVQGRHTGDTRATHSVIKLCVWPSQALSKCTAESSAPCRGEGSRLRGNVLQNGLVLPESGGALCAFSRELFSQHIGRGAQRGPCCLGRI